jgi:hypothetical protein
MMHLPLRSAYDLLQCRFDVVQHFLVAQPQHREFMLLHDLVSHSVALRLRFLAMNSSVQFNYQPLFTAEEIGDEVASRVLAAKFPATQLAPSDLLP